MKLSKFQSVYLKIEVALCASLPSLFLFRCMRFLTWLLFGEGQEALEIGLAMKEAMLQRLMTRLLKHERKRAALLKIILARGLFRYPGERDVLEKELSLVLASIESLKGGERDIFRLQASARHNQENFHKVR